MISPSEFERARREVVGCYLVPDPVVETALAEACRLATVMLGCPAAAVELVGDQVIHVSAAFGVRPGLRRRGGTVADVLLELPGTEAVLVGDATADARFASVAGAADAGAVRFLAAVPLVSPEGLRLGVFRVWDGEARTTEPGQRASIEGLGRLVLAQLNLLRRQRELEQLEERHARTESALRETEARYRGMFENVVVGLYQTTPEGRYLAANPMLARIYGYGSPAELMGGIGDIEHELYVDPKARDRFKRALQEENTISNFEAQIRRKDGQAIWIVENARVVRDERGEVLFYEGTVQDITSRKLAEEQLRNAERLYHTLVEDLPQNIFRKDKDERFILANTRFCETVGRPAGEILGRTDYDLFPPELARKYQADDQRVMAEGRTVRVTERNVAADGSVHWVEVIKTPLVGVGGGTIGIQGIFWDVTETKRLQDELAYERDLLRALLVHSPDIIYFKDTQSRFLKVGNALAERFGVSPESLVGRTAAEYLEPRLAQAFLEEEQQLLRTGQPLVNKVEEVIDAQGHRSWASVTKVPIYNRLGEIQGLVGVARDITKVIETEQAFREAEEKYRNMVENSVEGIYQTSPEGRFLSVNPAIVRIYKYASKEEMMSELTDVGRQVYLKPGRREEFTAAVLAAGSVTGFESEVRCADGSIIWISESARPVRDREGVLLYFEGSLEDISARKQIEAEREKTRQAAVESARLKAEFLATVSHEIRTPLNAIVPNAAMLVETALDLHQKYLVESIDHGARMLLQIVNDVLDFTRVDAGALHLEEIGFDLLDTVERALGAFAGLALHKQLELIGDFRPGVPRRVVGDPSRLGQILNNLLGNALKFTSAGEVALRVEPGPFGDGRLEVRFAVRDTGIGIAPEARSRVFQAFAQADGSMSRRYGGTGLGLAITRGYVELMGGAIEFDSELERGTTFRFSIKVGLADAAAGGGDSRPAPDLDPGVLPLEGMRVLVLDDNAAQLVVLGEAFARVGAALVLHATDPSSAIERLSSSAADGEAVDLVFFDPSVAGGDVETLADELRAAARGCRLIAVAPPGSGGRDRGLGRHGVLGFLIKPLRTSSLAMDLAAILSGERPAAAPNGIASGPAGPGGAAGRGCRVLLVEDNPLNQRVAVQLLERIEATVDAVGNGIEALQAHRERAYDLILMDCQMPGMDGCETTRRIREMEASVDGKSGPTARIPIVGLSANAFSDDRHRGLSSGMDDYLTKPLSLPELVRVFRGLCGPKPVSVSGSSEGPGRPAAAVPILDLAPLRALAGPDDPGVANEFIDDFLREAPERLDRIAAAAAGGEAAKVKSEAHTWKGNASYMGACRLVEALSALEAAGQAGAVSSFEALLARMRSEYAAASAALEAMRDESGKNS